MTQKHDVARDTLAQFYQVLREPSVVYAQVALSGDMSDYVRVVKESLVRQLRGWYSSDTLCEWREVVWRSTSGDKTEIEFRGVLEDKDAV